MGRFQERGWILIIFLLSPFLYDGRFPPPVSDDGPKREPPNYFFPLPIKALLKFPPFSVRIFPARHCGLDLFPHSAFLLPMLDFS